MTRIALPASALFVGSVLLAACGGTTQPTPVQDLANKGGNTAAQCDAAAYPCGPYGFQPSPSPEIPGSVIANLTLSGKKNSTGAISEIKLSDYYQNKNIKVLVMTSSAEWCGPCKAEQPGLVKLYNDHGGANGTVAILGAVVQANDGSPSTEAVLDRWAKAYKIPFDLAIDPAEALAPYYDLSAFPMQMVIRTSDMRITFQQNGLDEAHLNAAVEAVLAAP